MVVIRDATPADVGAITEITNAQILTTTYEWTSTPHAVADRLAWLERHRVEGRPVIVAADGATVVGWAGFGDFRDTARWPGYLPVVEHTIHVRQGHWGQGIGRLLIDALAERARHAGKRVMVGAIDGENIDSIDFHRRLGFVEVGRMPGIGEKFGRPLDLVLMQLDL
ncbi:MAG: N-acetyltransferase family protein [Acidimicrobiales bacterium]